MPTGLWFIHVVQGGVAVEGGDWQTDSVTAICFCVAVVCSFFVLFCFFSPY